MVAISTTNNGVAMAALRRVNADLTTTQNRIATGYRVNSAKDDASVWATATQIRSDISASDSLKSGMSTAMAQADAASAALEEIGNLLSKVSDIVTAAKVAGDGNASQLAEVKVIGNTIKALIAGSAVNGVNLIDSASNSTTTKVTVSNGSAVGDMSFSGVDVALSTTKVGAILASTLAATDIDGLDVAGAQTEVANAATKIGAYSRGLDTMIGFTSKLADVRNNALGGLVDADLERETAKLQALQVRQQLAYQALSMSNNSAQNILMLFR